jgi:uncharacterized repeat protein (TIGR01451 family)
MNKLYAFFFVAAGLILSQSAMAQGAASQALPASRTDVESRLAVFQIKKDANGKEVLSAADKASPGETLQYQVTYRNNGKSAVTSLTATLPLPDGLAYVPGSARPANPQASVDGKTFASMPLKTLVKMADGKLQEQLVPYSDYRALRWSVGSLPANDEMAVSARVQVNPVSGSVAPQSR